MTDAVDRVREALPRVHLRDAPRETLLAVYVRDHLAGSHIGLEVARRALRHASGTSYETELRDVVRQIDEDRRILLTVAEHLGIPRPRSREALGGVAQAVGGAKLNGQILGTSPLSRLVELEGLLLGVRGKLQLWRALEAALGSDELPEGVDATELAERAADQLAKLTDAHARAARAALQVA